MGFSSVIVEQREKEAKALKSFLFCSLIASLVFHIGVLALGIGKFIQRVSQTQEEPIEITIVETLPEIIAKPQDIKNSQRKINYASGSSRGGGNNDVKSSIPTKTTLSMNNAVIQPVVTQNQLKTSQNFENFVVKQPQKLTVAEPTIKQPTVTTTPIPENITEPTIKQPTVTTTPIPENIAEPRIKQPTVTTTPIPEITEKISEQLKTETTTQPTGKQPEKTDVPVPKLTSFTSVSSSNTSTTYTDGNILNNLRNSLRNNVNKTTGNGVGNGIGNGVGNSAGNGIGNGEGNSAGNGIGNGVGNSAGNGIGNGEGNKAQTGDKPVAIAPKPRSVNGTKLNRADCIKCNIKYPDKARRRGIEGSSEVAIDTDNDGNVTFVQLIRSSGDSELDEAAQEAVQEWKLTPLDGGRQGVRASINFAIKGSQRHREIKQRQQQKQREASQSNQSKPKITNPIGTDIIQENITKPEQESIPLPNQPISPAPSLISEDPVKSDIVNQVDENKTQELVAPSSSATGSNSEIENR